MRKRNVTWHLPASMRVAINNLEITSHKCEQLANDECWDGDYETGLELARYVEELNRGIEALRKLEAYCDKVVDEN